MGHRPFTPEWAEALRVEISASAAYRAAAAKWTWPVALVLDAAPHLGYPEAVAVELELHRGECHGAQIRAADAVSAPFVLRAAYATWKAVVTGSLDPIVGVTRGLIKVHGSLTTLLMHAPAATALCGCAQGVATRFPDET
jgi:putative sterol carrier protein